MRIEEVEIKGFGKWTDARFRFAPGINLVIAENEAGKTTLMEAILALLYGFKRDYVRRNIKRPEWERYRPWDSSLYAGTITYRLKGKVYQIRRNFDSDEHRLYDAETFRELTQDYPMDARRERPFLQEQTGLTRTLFEELTRIGRVGIQDGKNMMEWLHQLKSHDEGEASYHEVFALLEKKRREIGTGQGKGTLLGQALKRLEEAKEELEEARRNLSRLRALEERHHQLKAELKKLENRIQDWEMRWQSYEEELKRWSGPEELYQKRERLLLDKQRWEAIFADWNRIRSEESAAQERLKALEQRKRIDHFELEGLEEALREAKVKQEALAALIKEAEERKDRRRSGLRLYAVFLAAAGAGALMYSNVWAGLLLLSAGLFLGILAYRRAFSLQRREFKGRNAERLAAAQEQERRLLRTYGLNSYEEYLRFREEQRAIHQEEQEIQRQLAGLQTRKEHLASKVTELMNQQKDFAPSKPGADPFDVPAVAEAKIRHDEAMLARLQEKIEAFSLQRRRLRSLEEELQEEQRELQEDKARIERELARIKGEMSVFQHLSVDEKENQYALAWEEVERLQQKRRILDLAQQLFEEALDEWNRMVSPEINHRASEIFRFLTGGKYEEVRASPLENFRLRVIEKENRSIREHSQLSQGAEGQLYFAFRLSLLHRFSPQIPLPIFLDDSFAHYDPVRLQRALACLCEKFSQHQVFLFSCQGREQEFLERMGADFVCIPLAKK